MDAIARKLIQKGQKMKFQKMTLVDLSGIEWDVPKNNEKEIYECLGRFIVEFESLASSIIQTIEWIYFSNGLKNKSHSIQIFLNKEDISALPGLWWEMGKNARLWA